MRAVLALLGACFFWLAPAPPAHALGCILLGCDCTVSATDIDFPDFNPLLGGAHTAVGQVQVSCTGVLSVGAGVVVELDDGQWGTFSARRMRSDAGDWLDYNIYTTSAHTAVWGDGTLGSVSRTIGGGLIVLGGWSASRDMFGRLVASPSLRPGEYQDTVVVRVIF